MILVRRFILTAVLCYCAPAQTTPEPAFKILEAFQGNWRIAQEGKQLPIEMSYDTASKQSIVTERFGKELSVFYRNGKSVEMVHFCNAGNQPRLRLKPGGKPSILDFEVFSATNLRTPDAPHVREIIYTIVDAKTMDVEIFWVNGNGASEKYHLTKP